jgi:Fe-S-cluster containining protein
MAGDNVVEPYPEIINNPGGSRYTLGWSLRREDGNCRFLVKGLCSIYANRPWICRTYPFMLDGDNLVVSECESLGWVISEQEANLIARTLLECRCAEEEEERRVQKVLQKSKIPPCAFVVIDSEGMRVIES